MKTSRTPLAAAILLGLSAPPALAQLPENQDIAYHIRQTPDDPESDILFTVTLKLAAQSRSGNSVTWGLLQATFEQFGGTYRSWTDNGAVFDTQGGTWQITHADWSSPVTSEFVLPPRLTGTADHDSEGYTDLDYDFEAAAYAPPEPPEEPPFGANTAAAAYRFQRVGESEPDFEETEEEIIEADEA